MTLYNCSVNDLFYREIRDGIRSHLMDPISLEHLETCGSINWNTSVLWQYRPAHGGEWSYLQDTAASKRMRQVLLLVTIYYIFRSCRSWI